MHLWESNYTCWNATLPIHITSTCRRQQELQFFFSDLTQCTLGSVQNDLSYQGHRAGNHRYIGLDSEKEFDEIGCAVFANGLLP